MPRSPLTPRWGIALALTLTACGARPPQPSVDPNPPTASADQPGLPAAGAFLTPPRAQWGGGGWLATPLEQRLASALRRSVTPPAAADCLAREYAARFAVDGEDPDPATVQHLNQHCGGWARPARIVALSGSGPGPIEQGLARLGGDALAGAVGVGAVTRPDGGVTAALVFPAGQVQLEPVQRTATAARLAGQVLRADGALELWRRAGDGVSEAPLTSDATGQFEATLTRAADEPVTYELAARQGRFRRTLALLTLGPPAATYPASPRRPRPPLAAIRDDAVAAINRQRRAAGAPPLTALPRLAPVLDDWLARVAAGEGGDAPSGLLDAEGRPFAQVAFALGEGADGRQAAELVLGTPTGLATLTDATLTEVAVGARPFDRGEGVDLVVAAVQGFTARPPSEARPALLSALNAARAAVGAPPVQANPALDAVVQSVAHEALAGTLPWQQVADVVGAKAAEAELVKGAFGVGGLTAVALTDVDFSREPAALDPSLRHVGLGVAGGALPGQGAPRHVVLFITAEALNDNASRPATPAP